MHYFRNAAAKHRVLALTAECNSMLTFVKPVVLVLSSCGIGRHNIGTKAWISPMKQQHYIECWHCLPGTLTYTVVVSGYGGGMNFRTQLYSFSGSHLGANQGCRLSAITPLKRSAHTTETPTIGSIERVVSVAAILQLFWLENAGTVERGTTATVFRSLS